LSQELLEGVGPLGYTVEEATHRVGHIFGIRMPEGLEMDRLKTALQREKVVTSLRGSALRVSPQVYNDRSDMDALLRALRAATAWG